jgi:hypothetical protein
MKKASPQTPWSVLSAAVLAVGTLYVFYALQDYGPESTVRRFQSVVNSIATYTPPEVQLSSIANAEQRLSYIAPRDLGQLERLMAQPAGAPSVGFLVDLTRPYAYAGARYEIVRVDYRRLDKCIVVAMYHVPEVRVAGRRAPRQHAMVYVVERKEHSWQINADEMITFLRDLGGG